jgi:leucyl/phenylalanyl-tRNA--protein transferase
VQRQVLPLNTDLLLRAYMLGLFPMAEDRDSEVVHWIEPRARCVIPLDGFHVPRRLRRTVRRRPFELAVDRDFAAVIRECAAPAPGRERSWLNDQLVELYIELHRAGFAHSVECRIDGVLAGGLYGVSLGRAFFGESMFSRVRDASKVALVELVGRLRAAGYALLDAQFVTEHLSRFGAVEIPRAAYRRRLSAALAAGPTAFPRDDRLYGLDIVAAP